MPETYFQGDLEFNLKDFFEASKKFPTELIVSWLVFRRNLHGISPIVPFKMIDPVTGILDEFYICNNKQYSFNKKGLSPAGFKPGGIWRFMFDSLMETVYIPSKNLNSKLKDSINDNCLCNYHLIEKKELQKFVQTKIMNGREILSAR